MQMLVIFLGGVVTEYIDAAMSETSSKDWDYFCSGLHGKIIGELNHEYDHFLDQHVLLRAVLSKIKRDYRDEVLDHMYSTFHSNSGLDIGHEIALIPETSSNSMLLVSKCFVIDEFDIKSLDEFV